MIALTLIIAVLLSILTVLSIRGVAARDENGNKITVHSGATSFTESGEVASKSTGKTLRIPQPIGLLAFTAAALLWGAVYGLTYPPLVWAGYLLVLFICVAIVVSNPSKRKTANTGIVLIGIVTIAMVSVIIGSTDSTTSAAFAPSFDGKTVQLSSGLYVPLPTSNGTSTTDCKLVDMSTNTSSNFIEDGLTGTTAHMVQQVLDNVERLPFQLSTTLVKLGEWDNVNNVGPFVYTNEEGRLCLSKEGEEGVVKVKAHYDGADISIETMSEKVALASYTTGYNESGVTSSQGIAANNRQILTVRKNGKVDEKQLACANTPFQGSAPAPQGHTNEQPPRKPPAPPKPPKTTPPVPPKTTTVPPTTPPVTTTTTVPPTTTTTVPPTTTTTVPPTTTTTPPPVCPWNPELPPGHPDCLKPKDPDDTRPTDEHQSGGHTTTGPEETVLPTEANPIDPEIEPGTEPEIQAPGATQPETPLPIQPTEAPVAGGEDSPNTETIPDPDYVPAPVAPAAVPEPAYTPAPAEAPAASSGEDTLPASEPVASSDADIVPMAKVIRNYDDTQSTNSAPPLLGGIVALAILIAAPAAVRRFQHHQ